MIDPEPNKEVSKVMFNIEPFNYGHIECDNTTSSAPLAQRFYVYSGSECTAKPNPGFEFVSWQENLGQKNSTQLISLASQSIWDPIVDFFHLNHDKPEAILNITKFRSFTANFRALPPIPAEYMATSFGIVATAFVSSWLTPTAIDWRKTRMQRKYFKECIDQIGVLDRNAIEDKIIGYYADGRISQDQYQLLKDKISEYYQNEKYSKGYGAPFT